jgi:hypothetical protein
MQPLAGERYPDESADAVKACNDYLRLQIRSVKRLYDKYVDLGEKGVRVPSTSFRGMTLWSAKYDWQARAEAYDVVREAEEQQLERVILSQGVALKHRRVMRLARIEEKLFELIEQNMHLQTRVKSVGAGERQRIVREIEFNAGLIREYRGVLDDIAKEVGGRRELNAHMQEGLATDLSKTSKFEEVDIEDADYELVTGISEDA